MCVIWSQCGSPSGLCVTRERARIVPEDLPLCEGRAVLWAEGANRLIHCCQELTSYCQLTVLHFILPVGSSALHTASWQFCTSYCQLAVLHFIQPVGSSALHTASWQFCTLYCQLAVLHFNWSSATPRLDSDLSRTVSWQVTSNKFLPL